MPSACQSPLWKLNRKRTPVVSQHPFGIWNELVAVSMTWSRLMEGPNLVSQAKNPKPLAHPCCQIGTVGDGTGHDAMSMLFKLLMLSTPIPKRIKQHCVNHQHSNDHNFWTTRSLDRKVTSLESSCHQPDTEHVRTSQKSPNNGRQSNIGLLTQVAAWLLSFQCPVLASHLCENSTEKKQLLSASTPLEFGMS